MKIMTRRTFIKLAFVGFFWCTLNLLRGRSVLTGKVILPDVKRDDSVNGKAGSVFDQAEEQTRRILFEMQTSLRKRLANDPESFTDSLRMRLINMAMWPPIAPIAQDFLTYLGDNEQARKQFDFLMPLVEWMSTPFLFPVETGGAPDEQAKEADKVFNLMADLRNQGFSSTLDNVGDASLSPKDAQIYQKYYATLIRSFIDAGKGDELCLSLKLSALVHNLEAAIGSGETARAKQREISDAITNLLGLAAEAPDKTIFIRIDMEEYCYKDLTLQLFRKIIENNPSIAIDPKGASRLGLVIQAYLRDSAADVRDLVNWARPRNLRVPIRLVKGAYLDYERQVAAKQGYPSPVWDNKPSTDANYEAVSACMLLNLDAVLPAFATHNIRTQAHAIALAEAYGLPNEDARVQMLYGMGDPIKHIVVEMGRPMREYIPAGSLARGLKYSGRRFEELSNSDNALAKTMRGDFSGVDGSTPIFMGEQDIKDSRTVQDFLARAIEGAGR